METAQKVFAILGIIGGGPVEFTSEAGSGERHHGQLKTVEEPYDATGCQAT